MPGMVALGANRIGMEETMTPKELEQAKLTIGARLREARIARHHSGRTRRTGRNQSGRYPENRKRVDSEAAHDRRPGTRVECKPGMVAVG